MAYTIETALSNPLISVMDRNDDLGFYSFRVGSLQTVVHVEVGRLPSCDKAKFQRSHNIRTPVQMSPYATSIPYWDDVPYALHQAIDGLTSYYQMAVDDGHKPDEKWLVKA